MNKNPAPDTRYNRIQASRYLGISNALMGVWLREGTAPRHQRFGRRRVFRREDLDAFAENHTREPRRSA